MYLEVFIHTQDPFFSLFFGINFPFIGWGFDLLEFSLKVVIIFLPFLARRGWAITRRTVIFLFWEIRGVFFSSLLFWTASPSFIMTNLFVEWVGCLWGFTPVKFRSKYSFIYLYSLLSFVLSPLNICKSACRLCIVFIKEEFSSTMSSSSWVGEFMFPCQLLFYFVPMIWTVL